MVQSRFLYSYSQEMELAPEYQLPAILPAMIFTSRPDGSWNYVNPAFCAYTASSAETCMGFGWTELVYGDDRATIIKRWQTAVHNGAPFMIEYRLCGADGSYHWCRTEVAPQHNAQGACVRWAGIIVPLEANPLLDIERNLRHVAEQARDKSDSVLAISAHELRSPLTVLLGQTRLLQRRLGSRTDADPADRRAVDMLVDQTLRLSALVHALLDVTQIDHGGLHVSATALDLSALVWRVVQVLQPTLPIHTLRLNVGVESLIVAGDALRLEQVLQNLLQNAVKYSPAGGDITITVSSQGSQVRITVQDPGIGIASDMQPYIFQRFVRARSDNGNGHVLPGLGIGLYLCKAIMDLHHGQIEVESSAGKGSTFTLTLPRIQP